MEFLVKTFWIPAFTGMTYSSAMARASPGGGLARRSLPEGAAASGPRLRSG